MALPNALAALFQESVTDVLISGPWFCQVDRGRGLEQISCNFGTEENLLQIAIEFALENGARVDMAKPIADFSVGQIRAQVVLPFGVSNNTQISLRRHPNKPITLDGLEALGMVSAPQARFLRSELENHGSILITGTTGSGKTTLLSALVSEGRQRVVCIEQTPELMPQAPAISLTEREANQDGFGGIDAISLITSALRMRPDRLVLGEVRGREFGALLLAANSGHSAMATIHAKSPSTVSARLAVLGQIAGYEPSLTASLVRSGFTSVVSLSPERPRKILSVSKFNQVGPLELEPIDA